MSGLTTLTYGQFLLVFLLLPIVGLAFLLLRAGRQKRMDEKRQQGVNRWWLLTGLVILAIIYTIPWDNHLIAEGVWWYDSSLVSGVMLGHIPLEEVLFFPLQTILIGLWTLWLMPRLAGDVHGAASGDGAPDGAGMETGRVILDGVWKVDISDSGAQRRKAAPASGSITRWIAVIAAIATWLAGLLLLLQQGGQATYLGWELVWALPPLTLQLGLGADLLWRRRRLLLAALLPVVAYLGAADALAIHTGIWTIAPRWSLGALVGGALPLEELIFFLLTSTLVIGGLIVGAAPETRQRVHLSS
jgi:lycopene cyclase domain-containing protein